MAFAVSAFGASAYAQTPPDATEPGAGEGARASSPGWRTYPRERHLLVRLEATGAFRLSDPLNHGAVGPIGGLVQGTYAFVHAGDLLLGPSVGVQIAGDHTGLQYAVQPGVALYRRFSPTFALTARVDVPILITRGLCDDQQPRVVPDANRNPANPSTYWLGSGASAPDRVPTPEVGFCPTTAVGVEAAAGAALYLRAGLAVTGEVTFNTYFGNGGLTYPMVGAGLGLLLDYEVLP